MPGPTRFAPPAKAGISGGSSRSTLDPNGPGAAVRRVLNPTDPAIVMTMNEELMDVMNDLENAGLVSSASGLQFLLRWQTLEPVQRMMLFRTIERNMSETDGLQRIAQLITLAQES